MGVIKRQGLKQSIVVYAGTVIGMLNVLYFYPRFFSPEELGLVRFLIDTSILFAPFFLVGATNLSVRFFPEFKNEEKGHNGFLNFLLLYAALGILLSSALYFAFREPIYNWYAGRDPLFAQYFHLIWFGVVLLALSSLVKKYTSNFKRIAIPTLIHDYLLKIGVPTLAFLYFMGWMSFQWLTVCVVTLFAADLVLQLLYLAALRQLKFGSFWGFLTKKRLKSIFAYGMFGLLSGLGSRMISYLDSFMVGTLYSLEGLAVFYIAFVMAHVMTVPSRAINNIAAPVISDAWNRNDTAEIDKLYRKSSMLLLTVALGFFMLIWTNIDAIYQIMPNGDFYAQGKTVILILAIAKLIDLSTAMNGQIIAFSKYYRFNLYSLGVLAVANVIMNILLIPRFGINGAAMATLISLTAFNAVKFGFVWYRFGMQPFNWSSLKMTLCGVALIIAGPVLPDTGMPFLDVAWQSFVIGGCFLAIVLWTDWCEDLKKMILEAWVKLRVYF